jgi:O-antigen/teichoic acid export membrane protein
VLFASGFANLWWTRAKKIGSVLRLKPFDDDSPEGRSKERYRRIALTSLAAIAAKAVGVLTALVSVPLTFHYLGNERYGVWMTINSVIAMVGFADLGMGSGLVNAIAEADGKDDAKTAHMYVSSAFYLLLGIALCLLLGFLAVYRIVPWARIYNITPILALQEAGPATAVLFISFVVNMPLGIVQRVQMGYQEGFRTNIWIAVGAILSLAGVLIAIHYEANLPWLVLAISAGPLLAVLFNWYECFFRSRSWLFPKWEAFNWISSRKVVGTGALFLILQLLALIGSSSDNIIITHVLGVSAVAGYAITQKLFSITQIAQYFILPLWPAFGEAAARNDHAWARRTLNRALILSFGLGVLTVLPLVFFGKQIITFWIGSDVIPSTTLLLGFAFWALLGGYGGVMSTFLSSGRLLGKQIWFYAAASIGAVCLKVILAANWQVAGVIWATVLAYGAFYVIPAFKLAYGSLRELPVHTAQSGR